MMKRKFRGVPYRSLIMALLLTIPWGIAVAAPEAPQPVAAPAAAPAPSSAATAPAFTIDKTELSNGGVIKVTGTAPAGKPVYLEVWAADTAVRANRFDNKKDKETGKIPYIFYLTHEMPAYYKIFIPKSMEAQLKELGGKDWSFSKALKETGADVAYSVPAGIKIDHYQASIMASIIGSRGDLLPALNEKENRKRSMQLVKARFRSLDKVMGADLDVAPDGNFAAEIKIRSGLAPGKYKIVAVVDKNLRSEPVEFENKISFPVVYLGNAGTSLNLLWPFVLTLVVAIFGVLMGAGGGFILNPLLVSIFPALPHTVVAGTVMPTVLFSQGSGIYNYSKIKFINWKLGCGIGAAMLLGGFIGPKLTEMITLSQFKFAFGWILLVLAGLMFWQTTPGYLDKNKKEQAILKEFKKRAEEAAKAKQG